MRLRHMYNSHNDPAVGFLDFIVCAAFYLIGAVMHDIPRESIVTNFLKNASFFITIVVGLLTIMKTLGIEVNLRKRFKKKR
jgi:hypothetical protein